MSIITKTIKPSPELQRFVESFWMLKSDSSGPKEVVILPDGRVDLTISSSLNEAFHITLMGLETDYGQATIFPQTTIFAVSFNPLATEYIFASPIASLTDRAERLPAGYWDLDEKDLKDFDGFCKKVSRKITELCDTKKTGDRRQKLFEMIYASKGSATVKEIADRLGWSSRQINRYFNDQFGLSLKAYCNIIRFRSSFHHLKQGKLFPEEHFADQSHFIKEIKKLSGVSPKKLAKNQNDRFIQFSALPPK